MRNRNSDDRARHRVVFSGESHLTPCWEGAEASDETRECKPLEMRRLGLLLCALSAAITVASATLITIWL